MRVYGTRGLVYPKGLCTEIVHTLALKQSLYRYTGDKVYTIWVHGPLGLCIGFKLRDGGLGCSEFSFRVQVRASQDFGFGMQGLHGDRTLRIADRLLHKEKNNWVLVEGFNLSCHNKETTLFTVVPYSGNLK